MSTVLANTEVLKKADVTITDRLSDSKAELSSSSIFVDEIPPLGAPRDPNSRKFWFSRWTRDPDSIATQPSVFDDPATLEIYRPPPQFENSHRFDPLARWTWREEQKIVRKIDLRIMLWTFIMFLSMDLDRSNISQANTDNFLQDLHMTTNDFNLGNTLYKTCFLIAELPSQMVSKRVGPDVWIPSQMVLWSLISLGQFWLKGRASFLAFRCILGLLQGGFIPDVILYLSYFYTTNELPLRLAWFWVSNYTSSILGAFLATGILRLRGTEGKSGWKWLFLLEGLVTLVVGLASFILMPPGPTQTKAWYRPKGWFTEREEVIMVNRVLRDDPSKSDMHNRQGLTFSKVLQVIKDWRMWPIYALGLTHMLPVTPPHTYLTLSLRTLGFSTTQSNLLTIPSTVLGILMLLLFCYLSEVIDSRVGAAVLMQFWALPLLAVLYTFDEHTSQWVYYAVVSILVSYPYIHPIQVAWASTNSYSVGTRTVSASIYNMFVQASAVIGANIYRADDAPLYRRGNRALIAIAVMNIVIYFLSYVFYRSINARRAKIWNAWTPKQRQEYLDTTKDEGNEKLNFRFAY
ncbi:MFS general substrate transporter [Cristinia sonorae]|uniref:MFS general substrate transporter n=1 Tax=Cristinia sonorae TaxID=1940300 RepID=A0A8K0XRK7_9AGAR|nr:MFS general substrate transporter [Cristinia sonorae]